MNYFTLQDLLIGIGLSCAALTCVGIGAFLIWKKRHSYMVGEQLDKVAPPEEEGEDTFLDFVTPQQAARMEVEANYLAFAVADIMETLKLTEKDLGNEECYSKTQKDNTYFICLTNKKGNEQVTIVYSLQGKRGDKISVEYKTFFFEEEHKFHSNFKICKPDLRIKVKNWLKKNRTETLAQTVINKAWAEKIFREAVINAKDVELDDSVRETIIFRTYAQLLDMVTRKGELTEEESELLATMSIIANSSKMKKTILEKVKEEAEETADGNE